MKSVTSFVFAGALLLTLVSQAQAQDYDYYLCSYDGEWYTYDSGNSGAFVWSVTWTINSDGTATLIGDYTDDYGASYLDGSCTGEAGSGNCTLTQTYTSGQLNGNVYYWSGSFYGEWVGSDIVNYFAGTWGYSSYDDGGSWSAVATCSAHNY